MAADDGGEGMSKPTTLGRKTIEVTQAQHDALFKLQDMFGQMLIGSDELLRCSQLVCPELEAYVATDLVVVPMKIGYKAWIIK